MILRTLPVGPLQTNCYLVACSQTHRAMVVDPGGNADKILAELRKLDGQLEMIVLTHAHWDHTIGAGPLRQATGARLAVHRLDAGEVTNPSPFFRQFAPQAAEGPVIDLLFEDEETFAIGELDVRVLATPGHSPGGISLYMAAEKTAFTGDALFREGIGRTDFPGGSYEQLLSSIEQRLLSLPDDTVAYPGHGPATTIGHERRHNPWVGQAAR